MSTSPEDELYGLLKGASGASEAPGEGNPVEGKNPLDDESKELAGDAAETSWGGPGSPGAAAPVQHSDGVGAAAKDSRQGTARALLEGGPQAYQADQKAMAENFEHVSSGDFETHSLHLVEKAKTKMAHPRTPTLAEQVRKRLGQY